MPFLKTLGLLAALAFAPTATQAFGASTCASAWKSTGAGNCETAVAVCLAESGGNVNARNVNSDSHHSIDRGLWQINNYWHPEVSDSCAYNADCNARSAKSISWGGSNWTPWHTYTSGAYKSHLSAAASACGSLNTQEAAVETDESLALRRTIVLHEEFQEHCDELRIPGGKQSKFWKSYGWDYKHWVAGECPRSRFNYINRRVSDMDGFKGVDMTERGIKAPKKFTDLSWLALPTTDRFACPSECGCCPKNPDGSPQCPCLCGGGWCPRCCK